MKHSIAIFVSTVVLTGCLGQGKRQAERLERIYGMPMSEILAKERPKQIEERRRAGEHIEIEGEKTPPAKR
jgi:hypothetical protein